MDTIYIFPCLLASLFVTFLVLVYWIKHARKKGFLWEDMNVYGYPKRVVASGGVGFLIGFIVGVFFYIGLRTWIYTVDRVVASILALLCAVLLAGIVGLIDDYLGWKKGGLSWKIRVLLGFVASIPLVVINAGVRTVSVPFFGAVDFGLFYPLVLIPLGVAYVTTSFNFLAGLSGLEAGQGVLIVGFFSFVAYYTGSLWLAVVGLCMVVSLLTFLIFNWHPAKTFPGDVGTYSVGALIAAMAILGNFEKIGFIVFIPYVIETVLKVGRGKLNKHSFGEPQKNGNLKLKYDKIYGMTHVAIWFLSKFKKKVKIQDVVIFNLIFEGIFIAWAFFMLV
jgi:UDP-N-acetylglucosamine--dolichyl-phosphate N-acetylglucosaminephosphotransferase